MERGGEGERGERQRKGRGGEARRGRGKREGEGRGEGGSSGKVRRWGLGIEDEFA
jgi:hypothetical protein